MAELSDQFKEELKETVKQATSTAVTEHLKDFFIDREVHYEDHKFVQTIRSGVDKAGGVIVKTVTGFLIMGILTLIVWGMIAWGQKNF